MNFTANQIAEILEGEIVGNPDVEVSKFSKIEEGEIGSLSFLSNPKYTPFLYTTKASVVIVAADFLPEKEINLTLIKVKNPYASFSKLLQFYQNYKYNSKTGREQPHFITASAVIGKEEYIGAFAYIGENVTIGENVKIYPNAYIGDDCVIGDNCTIYAGVKIYHETTIGNHCKIHSGAIIGADGFGFAPLENGEYETIPQLGNVIIKDHVDIGAGSTIDRATMGSTVIGKGTKIDNQVQVAHNVEIGEHNVIASQTAIAGSAKIGNHCMIGGQVGIAGHITIGNNVKILGQSGVSKSTKNNETLSGSPSAFKVLDYNKSYITFKNLPKIASRIDALEKEFRTRNEK